MLTPKNTVYKALKEGLNIEKNNTNEISFQIKIQKIILVWYNQLY